ncbi:MAG: IS110 family transposase [Dysgonamonadaceae bacterium]|jgi:hypothetical protein|nr:IS110 family transposase [Dysgonamonadaceae bacterium]
MDNFEIKEMLTGLPIVNHHAGGIDVGSREMWVTYTDPEGHICQFKSGCFTKDLDEIVCIFQKEKVTDVAMESTGVYGGPLREKLEVSGINVTVINPGMYKKPNIKDDSHDSSWIHLYHSVDLFKKSHFAPEHWRDLREYIHERDVIMVQKAVTLTRMQRQLEMMNVKLQHEISDIEGVGAMKIIRAICGGETDPEKLVSLLNLNLFKATKEDLVESLRGNYRTCLVNVLKEKLSEYDFFVSQMRKYEQYIITILEEISKLEEQKRMVNETIASKGTNELKKNDKHKDPKTGKKAKKARKNEYSFDGPTFLCRILGIDLTKVEGFNDKTLLCILSVTGIDMSQWKSAQQFVSWLRLSPRPKKSANKVVGYDYSRTKNPATQAFRLCAQSLHNSKSPLGQLYRKLLARKGHKTAIKAVARKLAILFYTLIKNGTEYSNEYFETEKKKQIAKDEYKLQKLAKQLGYNLEKIAS